MQVYCDSVILIYGLDSVGPFQVRADNRLVALHSNGDQLAISDLTRLECRVGPMKCRDTAVLAKFDHLFARPDVRLVRLTAAVFDRAAQLRVDHGFKTPDALHLAAAIESGCGLFLTNDAWLSRCNDIPVEILP